MLIEHWYCMTSLVVLVHKHRRVLSPKKGSIDASPGVDSFLKLVALYSDRVNKSKTPCPPCPPKSTSNKYLQQVRHSMQRSPPYLQAYLQKVPPTSTSNKSDTPRSVALPASKPTSKKYLQQVPPTSQTLHAV